MSCSRLIFALSILTLRLTRSFQPIIVNSTQNSLSARRTKLSAIVATATSKMSSRTSETKDSDNRDEKNIVTFSSSLLLENNTKKNEHQQQQQHQQTRTALIILNYPIPKSSLLLEHLWKSSCTRIAADGGANRLYAHSKDMIPDRIRGDLDSLDPVVRAYYETQNVSVEQDFCQDTNDLDKALQVVCGSSSADDNTSNDIDRVVIYGAFGGRFDQEMASFAALYKWAPRINWQLYLYSDETCAFLIPANTHCEIRLPFTDTHNLEKNDNDNENENDTNTNTNTIQQDIGEGPTCGLIPLGCRCESVVTSGLKWDLDGTLPLEFGGLVSSSNRVMEPTVKVFASHPLIFTAELVSSKKII